MQGAAGKAAVGLLLLLLLVLVLVLAAPLIARGGVGAGHLRAPVEEALCELVGPGIFHCGSDLGDRPVPATTVPCEAFFNSSTCQLPDRSCGESSFCARSSLDHKGDCGVCCPAAKFPRGTQCIYSCQHVKHTSIIDSKATCCASDMYTMCSGMCCSPTTRDKRKCGHMLYPVDGELGSCCVAAGRTPEEEAAANCCSRDRGTHCKTKKPCCTDATFEGRGDLTALCQPSHVADEMCKHVPDCGAQPYYGRGYDCEGPRDKHTNIIVGRCCLTEPKPSVHNRCQVTAQACEKYDPCNAGNHTNNLGHDCSTEYKSPCCLSDDPKNEKCWPLWKSCDGYQKIQDEQNQHKVETIVAASVLLFFTLVVLCWCCKIKFEDWGDRLSNKLRLRADIRLRGAAGDGTLVRMKEHHVRIAAIFTVSDYSSNRNLAEAAAGASRSPGRRVPAGRRCCRRLASVFRRRLQLYGVPLREVPMRELADLLKADSDGRRLAEKFRGSLRFDHVIHKANATKQDMIAGYREALQYVDAHREEHARGGEQVTPLIVIFFIGHGFVSDSSEHWVGQLAGDDEDSTFAVREMNTRLLQMHVNSGRAFFGLKKRVKDASIVYFVNCCRMHGQVTDEGVARPEPDADHYSSRAQIFSCFSTEPGMASFSCNQFVQAFLDNVDVCDDLAALMTNINAQMAGTDQQRLSGSFSGDLSTAVTLKPLDQPPVEGGLDAHPELEVALLEPPGRR